MVFCEIFAWVLLLEEMILECGLSLTLSQHTLQEIDDS